MVSRPALTKATYDIGELSGSTVATAARQYAADGFLELTGVGELMTAFRESIRDVAGLDDDAMAAALDPSSGPCLFAPDVRQRLARVETTERLAGQALAGIERLLRGLIGPVVQVSSTFHAQFKGGGAPTVDHGGYASGHLEVHGAYLLHQDFTGANRPTSPSAVTLWLPLNTCPDWNLRVFPGSHRRGLICNRWLDLDDDRIRPLGEPVDITARAGRAVLFSALMLHGTSRPGAGRRVSCDLRFFPLCGFLPTTPRLLDPTPLQAIREALTSTADETLLAPLLEDQVFAGQAADALAAMAAVAAVAIDAPPPLSVLNWVNYIACVVGGRMDEAIGHLERFCNTGLGVDGSAAYITKFHGHAVHQFALAGETASA